MLRSKQKHFHYFPQLLKLFLAAPNIIVGDIRFFLNCHHSDSCVNFGRQRHLILVLLAVDSHSHAFLDVRGRQLIAQFYHKFADLLEWDNVFALGAIVDYLAASGDL